jgi:hypothetical protein
MRTHARRVREGLVGEAGRRRARAGGWRSSPIRQTRARSPPRG